MNTKAQSERHQRILLELVRQPGNDVCADCGGRAPRWASWNLGIFVCVQCAGVHRKMGTHITKVKSLTLDTWTREQVDSMKAMGNVKSNAKFNPDERRNRPPTNVDEAERHNELERFIVAKYKGRFMEHKPPPVPSKDPAGLRPPVSPARSRQASPQPNSFPSPAANGISRSRTAPIPSAAPASPAAAPAPVLPVRNGSALAGSSSSNTLGVLGPSSAAVPPRASSSMQLHPGAAVSNPFPRAQPAQGVMQSTARSSVFDDLISLQEGNSTPQPPLQMNPWAAMQQQQTGVMSSPIAMSNGVQPWTQQQQQQQQQAPQHSNSFTMGMQQQPTGVGAGQLGMQAFGVGRSASLGNMAFSPNGGGLGSPFGLQSQQSTGMLGAQMQAQQVSPSIMMGQQAFGGGGGLQSAQQTGYFGGANSPFGQQSQSPQPTLFTQHSHSPQPMFGQQVQQQQQQAGAPIFGAFASSMMPAGQQQQQQPQQTASPWQQQQQQQHQSTFGNAWGQGQANNGMW